ncbi:hypothetical protein NHF46_14525 [Arthrobacter alpinus]|nr:hypothetical protein [Arthrobacter alpinus]
MDSLETSIMPILAIVAAIVAALVLTFLLRFAANQAFRKIADFQQRSKLAKAPVFVVLLSLGLRIALGRMPPATLGLSQWTLPSWSV